MAGNFNTQGPRDAVSLANEMGPILGNLERLMAGKSNNPDWVAAGAEFFDEAAVQCGFSNKEELLSGMRDLKLKLKPRLSPADYKMYFRE